MKLNQDGIAQEDKQLAVNLRNYLINGNRVIGDPGEGLKQTLKSLEKRMDDSGTGVMDWGIDNVELIAQIAKTKAGIKGEEDLCEYLATLIKYDDKLDGLIAFASLSYEQDDNMLDYIPDTDTLLVYGNNLLVIDAKNLKTKAGKTLILVENTIMDEDEKEILKVHPSTHIWKDALSSKNIPVESIDGYVCIVNNTYTPIERDETWYYSHTKPIHISELKNELERWVQNKDNTANLKLLVEIAKAQIKKEKKISFDVDKIKRQFGI